MEQKKRGRARWVALGLIVGVVAAWGGFGLVGAAQQPSIVTCTKVSTGKMKIIGSDAGSGAKCTAKGKGATTTWDNHGINMLLESNIASELRFHNLVRALKSGMGGDFHGVDASNVNLMGVTAGPLNLSGANLSNSALELSDSDGHLIATGTNFSGAIIHQSQFTNENFNGANFTGASLQFQNNFGAGNSFLGAIWSNTTCPDATNSDANGGTCIGHLF